MSIWTFRSPWDLWNSAAYEIYEIYRPWWLVVIVQIKVTCTVILRNAGLAQAMQRATVFVKISSLKGVVRQFAKASTCQENVHRYSHCNERRYSHSCEISKHTQISLEELPNHQQLKNIKKQGESYPFFDHLLGSQKSGYPTHLKVCRLHESWHRMGARGHAKRFTEGRGCPELS